MARHHWNAQEYAKYSNAQKVWAQELIASLHLQGDETVLDVGCGDGKVTALLAEATRGKVLGIDKSESMVRLAQQTYSDLEFVQMDAEALCFKNEFDLIFSNAVLHWIEDHHAVAEGMYRALKSQGRIVLQFGGCGNAKEILEVMDDLIAHSYSKYFSHFTFPYSFPHSDTYSELLEAVGFKNIHAKLIAKDMVHESVDAFKGWIRTTWFPYTDCVPQGQREEFIDEFVHAYLVRYPKDAAQKIHVNMVRLEVEAIVP